jgi:hypothetical protein
MLMNNKAKTGRAAVAGVVGLVAGLAATTMLVSELAADIPDSTALERERSVSVSAYHNNYTGPRTADAAEAWFESDTEYTGPKSADAAEHWVRWLTRNERRIAQRDALRTDNGRTSMSTCNDRSKGPLGVHLR